jgi:hypothetical protein
MLVSTLCVGMNAVVMCAAGARSQTLAVQHLPRPGASPGRARRLAKASDRMRTPAQC